jgi:DNA gyrase/topoisomerase IV subunit B
MSADELKMTTLDPKKRRLLRVRVDEEVTTDQIINDLMGKDAGARFRFIMERAGEADAETLDV